MGKTVKVKQRRIEVFFFFFSDFAGSEEQMEQKQLQKILCVSRPENKDVRIRSLWKHFVSFLCVCERASEWVSGCFWPVLMLFFFDNLGKGMFFLFVFICRCWGLCSVCCYCCCSSRSSSDLLALPEDLWRYSEVTPNRFPAHGKTQDGKMQMRCRGEVLLLLPLLLLRGRPSVGLRVFFSFFFTGSSGGRRRWSCCRRSTNMTTKLNPKRKSALLSFNLFLLICHFFLVITRELLVISDIFLKTIFVRLKSLSVLDCFALTESQLSSCR